MKRRCEEERKREKMCEVVQVRGCEHVKMCRCEDMKV
jgi:hypothetical protein